MSDPQNATHPDTHWLVGGGEMGDLIRSKDWTLTPLGPLAAWPQSLKVVVRILLTSRYAMWMGWGPELTFLYNDAYGRMTLGAKHPWALGRPAQEVWAEIWKDIGPRIDVVLRTGVATWDEALLLFLERSGFPEETYHTFSYSPVPDDDGSIGGMLCVVTEETERIIGERRLSLLSELAGEIATTHAENEVLAAVCHCLAARPQDLPFALAYLFDAEGRRAKLACASGAPAGSPVAPEIIDLESSHTPWPVSEVRAHGASIIVDDLLTRFTDVPLGFWGRSPKQAVLVPIAGQGLERPAGCLIVAVNPYRYFDAAYDGFIDLLAGQIAAGLASARAYQAERQRAEELAELDRAKTVFFTNISHEFRTPLTLLLGPVEDMLAARAGGAAGENQELLAVVHRNALRLQKLVNTLLDFSRIESGRVQATYEPTDLASLTAELASVFRSTVEKAGMRLLVNCSSIAEPVYVDREMWEKIVLNLLSNAFKFTLEGEIGVALRDADDSVELVVWDTGSGIAEEHLMHIFDRFHRIEGVAARTNEGTGIGLALVQELVKLHGGTITARSTRGRGSTFTVTLPKGSAHLPADRIGTAQVQAVSDLSVTHYLNEALGWLPQSVEAPIDDLHLPAAAEMGQEQTSVSRPRVVWADDNADMRNYVRRLLSMRYDVEAVSDGEAALAAIRRNPPDLVLTDVMMPRLDGFGLLNALRADERTRTLPVVLISARAGEGSRVEGLEGGADDYIIKPFSARELLARVAANLQLSRVRREAEERVRGILESITDGFVLVNGDWRIAYMNAAAMRMFEEQGVYTADLIGRPLLDVAFPETRNDAAGRAIHRAITERVSMRLEYFFTRWQRWYALRMFPVLGDGLSVFFQDITDQKQAEEALREADRRKDEFLATLAHELRNPLAPIRNSLRILRLAGDMDQTTERVHDMMERQVNHMVRMVDDLMEVSRITSGKIELRKERVELTGVIRSAIETSRLLVDGAAQQLEISVPDEPLVLDADAVRLAQVFANLLNNASKYTDRAGHLWLAARREGAEVVVSVRDTGVGITAQMLPRVFDLFTQGDRSGGRTEGGLGIGLTLVRRLVELHGGSVEAHSDGPGKGSEFIVRLPLASGVPKEETRPESPPPAVLSARRILVVDDNRDAADSLGVLLAFMGAEVQVLYDGMAALTAMETFQPAVVLLDIGMPGMDGYEVARRIRQRPQGRDVTIIALTGWGQREDRSRTHAAGFDHHLIKPADLDALQTVLASLDGQQGSGRTAPRSEEKNLTEGSEGSEENTD